MTTPDPDHDDIEPEPRTPLDVDSTFAAIVSHFADADDESRPWPEQENIDLKVEPAASPPADPDPGIRVIHPVLPDPYELPPARAEAELEERFVPPDPGPLPRGDMLTRIAWAAVLGGPLFLLVAAMVWRGAPQLFVLIAVGAFIGGFVALVLRLPEHHDDDNDDGAVV